MYNPNDPRQRNWHRQNPVGRGGGFEQEPRHGTPARDARDQDMYGDRDDRNDPRDPRERDRRHDPRDYRAASDEGEAQRFGGQDSYGAHSRPPQEQGQDAFLDWREGNRGGNRDEIQGAPRDDDRDYARGMPRNRSNDYRAFAGDYPDRVGQPHQNASRHDENYWTQRGGADASHGESDFIRRDRGTWGSLGPRPNFGPDASNPGFPARAPKGAYAGRGPKGYRRSDDRIGDDVCQLLTDDPHVDASNIEVKVRDGEVTLGGTVDSRRTKRHAEDLIESIAGVKEIHNQLRIARSPA
jgi:hypothetical protein